MAECIESWDIASCDIALCDIASCDIALCDIAPWLGLGLWCAIAECIESCMALGLADWANATVETPPSITATSAMEIYFMEKGLVKRAWWEVPT